MLIFKRSFVFGLPLLIFIAYLLLFLEASWYYYLLIVIIIITLFCSWYLLGQKLGRGDFLNFLFAPIFFISSSFLFFTFLEWPVLKILLILLVVFTTFLFYNKIFQEFYRNQIWQLKSFRNIIFYLQILSIWFLASSFYGLIIFVNFSTVLALSILAIILLIFFGQYIWYNELTEEEGVRTANFVFLIVIIESLIVIKFLPISFYFKGLLLTIVYYLFSQGYLVSIKQEVFKKVYFMRSFIFILVLLTLIIVSNTINW
jgi:hypothetical protein